jgi:hypothetical protein
MPSRDPSPVPVLLVVLSLVLLAVVGVEALMLGDPSWWMMGAALGAVFLGAAVVLVAIMVQLEQRDDEPAVRRSPAQAEAPAQVAKAPDRHAVRRRPRRGAPAQEPIKPRSRA